MGIINCTPDSFFQGSRAGGKGLIMARRMIGEGAAILDFGGESSRPGSDYVSAEEELERVVPLISSVRSESDIWISVDTRKAAVAKAAIEAGADMVNDISALQDDPGLAPLLAEKGCPAVLMHKQGTPDSMQNNPAYEDPVEEIYQELIRCAQKAQSAGIPRSQLILDPGIGFGKTLTHNLLILRHLGRFKQEGYPVLMGLSRKSFLGAILNNQPEERLAGTLAANAWSLFSGADILRVHDVRETAELVKVIQAIRGAGE